MNPKTPQNSRDALLAAARISLDIENRQLKPARPSQEIDPYHKLLKRLDTKPNAREMFEAFSPS